MFSLWALTYMIDIRVLRQDMQSLCEVYLPCNTMGGLKTVYLYKTSWRAQELITSWPSVTKITFKRLDLWWLFSNAAFKGAFSEFAKQVGLV